MGGIGGGVCQALLLTDTNVFCCLQIPVIRVPVPDSADNRGVNRYWDIADLADAELLRK